MWLKRVQIVGRCEKVVGCCEQVVGCCEQMVGCCEHGYESSDCLKCMTFVEWRRNC